MVVCWMLLNHTYLLTIIGCMEKGRRIFNLNFVFVIRFKKSKRNFVYEVVGFEIFIKKIFKLVFSIM